MARSKYAVQSRTVNQPTLTAVGHTQPDHNTLITVLCKLVVFHDVLAAEEGSVASKWPEPGNITASRVMDVVRNLVVDGSVWCVVVHVSVIVSSSTPEFRRTVGLQEESTDTLAESFHKFLGDSVTELFLWIRKLRGDLVVCEELKCALADVLTSSITPDCERSEASFRECLLQYCRKVLAGLV